MDLGIRRGGLRRPVSRVGALARARVAVIVATFWILGAASVVDAHGGVATLQLVSERVNPGGTLELQGDMTAEGRVDIRLVADADGETRQLGVITADESGHFKAYLTMPSDLRVGSYLVKARSSSDEASTRVAIVGGPVGDDGGELPGQDEALAAVIPTSSATAPPVAGSLAPTAATPSPGAAEILLPLLAGVALALGLRTLVRIRAGRA